MSEAIPPFSTLAVVSRSAPWCTESGRLRLISGCRTGSRRTLGSYRVVGHGITRYNSRPVEERDSDVAHDRQVRMFGAAGQHILRASKIAVVGLGGIGSLVAEWLARLGVGNLILIDQDRIESSNLSRVVGATRVDVETRQLKTQIAIRHAREMAVDAKLLPIAGDVAFASVARVLRDCDFMFLAADSMRARLVVNALAHQYLIPVVQMGAKIRPGDAGTLEDAMCAVRQIRPGVGCLWCNGLIDSTELAIEAKSDEERKEQAYGVQEPNPSVITLNAVAAAHAVNDFLFDFLGLRTRGVDAKYLHFHFDRGKTERVIPRRDRECLECVQRLAMGDALELPVLEA